MMIEIKPIAKTILSILAKERGVTIAALIEIMINDFMRDRRVSQDQSE